MLMCLLLFFFFFNDTATTEIYTLSLHDALPILSFGESWHNMHNADPTAARQDRKSTRLNSSHANISYAVFCLKKKKTKNTQFYDEEKNKIKLAKEQKHKQT